MWNRIAFSHFVLLLSALIWLNQTAPAFAAKPQVTRVTPYGGQLGQTVDVVFDGDRLGDAEEVLCEEPGLTITEVTAVADKNGKQVTAKIAIDANSPLGSHRLRLRTRSGLSQIVNFFVGPYPVLNEKEPNSEFSAPQAVAINTTLHGRIENEDVDYFTVEMKKGERLSAEVEGLRLGIRANGSFFDPYLAIMNESRFELVAVDDHALTRQDAFVSLIIPEDGTYTIQLRDSAYGGGGNANYRLHIGHFSRPSGVLPAGGQPGETLQVKLMGDPAGDFEQAVTLPGRVPLSFGIYPEQNGLVTPTPNPLWVSSLGNVIEVEPNETLAQATPLTIPAAANGVVSSSEDLDYFKFSMKKDQEIDIDVIARRVRSSIDSVVDVYNDKGGRIAGDDDRKRPDSALRFKAPADGDYYVKVRDQLGNGGPDYFYRIELTPVQPSLEITVNEVVQYVQPDVVVPQGRRMAILATIRRENFGGPVTFSGENLPAGVSVASHESWAGDGTVPLMFHAAAEAPLDGQFAAVQGTWQNPNNAEQKLSANAVQNHLIIRANNNQPFWIEPFDTIPVVVSEQVPFDIQVITPQVPIVRGGTMNVKVVATKEEGFDEPIQLLVLQNPGGVNSSRTVKIEKGQTEALIPFNAAANAPLRESFITIRAIAKVGDADVEICSEYFPMSVAEKYMNLKFLNVAVDQGEATDFVVEVENLTPFEGEAVAEFVGLPPKTTTEPQKITKETTQIIFPIKTAADTPVGETKNMFCRITVIQNDEPILHQIGEGRLRVNKPAPVVVAKPQPPAAPAAAKKEEPKPKVLTRLEKLREQQEALRAQQEQ